MSIPLTASQRATVQRLIIRLHQGDESEAEALTRVIEQTERDIVRFRGCKTTGGVALDDLARLRLDWLTTYQRESVQQVSPGGNPVCPFCEWPVMPHSPQREHDGKVCHDRCVTAESEPKQAPAILGYFVGLDEA